MASIGDDENDARDKIGGRRTRSGRRVSQSAPAVAPSPARSTRRSSRKTLEQVQEQETYVKQKSNRRKSESIHERENKEVALSSLVEEAVNTSYTHQSDIIKEMLAEAAQGVIMDNVETVVLDGSSDAIYVDSDGAEHHEIIEYDEEIEMTEQTVEETQVDMTLQHGDCIIYGTTTTVLTEDEQFEEIHDDIVSEPQTEDVIQDQTIVDDDIEMYVVSQDDQEQDQQIPTSNMDEKSSSFPFGNVVQSENSEDGQKDEDEEATEEAREHCVESSLLASLAGDNANSLPSVGGGEESDSKKHDFEERGQSAVTNTRLKENSDDSMSEVAIAEDLENHHDSNATIVNTEIVSEEEMPVAKKPKVNDAEEVSDEELPAPPRAELPPDSEVISEDDLPVLKKKSTLSPLSDKNKRKNEKDKDKGKSSNATPVRSSKADEEYNPSSPTSESNDEPPAGKKPKLETKEDSKESISDVKEKKKR